MSATDRALATLSPQGARRGWRAGEQVMRSAAVRWVIVAAASAAGGGALAQIMSNPGQWYINNQIYSTRVFNSTVGTSMASSAPAGTARAEKVPERDVTRFAARPAPRMPAILAAREAGSAEARGAAQARYEAYVDLYRRTAHKDGFPADDLAYAYQYFVANNYQIHHDLLDVPADQDPRLRNARDGFARIEAAALKRQQQVSPLAERKVYQQFRDQLAARADVRTMTDAQKQEAAETLAIAYGVNFDGYLAGLQRRDDGLAQQARMQARTGLEKLTGQPIDRIRIDERGLTP
jgi:hypothetical protein